MTRDLTIGAGTVAVPAADPLLASKFAVPDAPPFTVERGRLLDRLSQAVRNPVTVVTGPPGSGKTQLAASWVSSGSASGTVVWLTLENGDDDPAVFWPYLVEGLHRSGIALSATIDEAARSAAFDRSMLARLAADLAAQQNPVVLVLDSVSVLADRQLAEDLDALLRHADRHLRMVLVGRWDPPLPLYRYRLSGTLSEIRGDALAFTVSEAAELLAGHTLVLPDWALRSLVERTEGWAAGLRLFALAMEGRTDAEDLIVTIAGDDANLAEYFLGEVLAAQPPDIRDFLLRTSIVDDFTPDLAEALIDRGDARHILGVLERANAFVRPIAEHAAAHRYHRLFAELLRAQLAYEEPAMARQLHRRAAMWLVTHGRTADAIRHAVQAKDWRHACAMVIQDLGIGRLVAGGEADRLGRLFRDMPADVEGPESALVTAAQRLASAEPDEAMKHLERAAASDAADSSPHQSVPMRLSLALLGTVLAGQQQDDARVLRAAEAAEACIALAPPERVADHPELRAIVLLSRGTSQSRSGALREAVATLTEGLKAAASAGGEGSRLACLEQLALANAYLGRLQEAARVATQAAQLAGRRGPPPQPSFIAAVVLAWVAAERWTVATAWRHLHAAETALAGCAESAVDSLATVAFALVRSRLLSGRGELSGAVRALDAIQTPDSQLPSWLQQEGVLTKARLAVAMGHLDEALAAVAALDDHRGGQAAIVTAAALVARDDAQQAGDLVAPVVKATDLPAPLLIEAWLIMAVAASDRDDAGTVRASVGQALALAAPDSHRRVFHQAGPRLRQLMRADSALAASYQALGHPPSAASGRRPSSLYAHAPIESLSERELEVLKHLAAMLGTEEIADTMYLSVNTVKTHVRGILRKLAASRRNEAVRRARELGIV